MSKISNPAKPFHQNELRLDETMISNEDSEEEDFHTCITAGCFLLCVIFPEYDPW